MDFESLELTRAEGVAEVVLRGPGKGNAMGPAFWRELPRAFDELDRDEAVRAVVVHGAGESFSYGLDLSAMMAELGPLVAGVTLASERTGLLDLITEMQRAFDSVEACRKPVIAAVHGWCIGGGLDLITACDVRLCSAAARFSLREVKLAIVADLGSLQRLPAIIGQGATRELAFTGKDIDAARAERIGLVSEVLPDRESLLEAARAMARDIAANPPLAVQGIKRVMRFGQGRAPADGLGYVAVWNAAFLQSRDLAEAFAAFAERRPPRFSGK